MLVMVVFFFAFIWIHLSTPLIRLFLLVLILLLMPSLNFLPVWFALSLLRFRLPSRLPMMFILWLVAMMVVIIPSRTVCLLTSFPVRRALMFMLVSWFGLTLPLLNAADWFGSAGMPRSEERFSRNAETDLVCRLLLEKKKRNINSHSSSGRTATCYDAR